MSTIQHRVHVPDSRNDAILPEQTLLEACPRDGGREGQYIYSSGDLDFVS